MKISDMILVSDLDGTIVPHMGDISEVNLAAIEKFRSLGGTFTIATGRSAIQAKRYIDVLNIKTPVIVNNGANIYDPVKNDNIWVKNFSGTHKQVIYDVINRFPEVGIVVISGLDRYDVIAENELVTEFRNNQSIEFTNADTVSDDCCKVLFLVNEKQMQEVAAFVINKNYPNEDFVISAMICLEMMPKGVSKGYPFAKLLEIYNKDQQNSIAIGDYNNDIEMLQSAGIGVAVDNALENVKAAANLVVKSCEENGLADLIEILIKSARG